MYYMKQNEPKRIIHNNLLHYMLRDCFDKCKSLQVVGFCIASTLVCKCSHMFLNYEEGNPGIIALFNFLQRSMHVEIPIACFQLLCSLTHC